MASGVLKGEPFAGATGPGLDLIKDEERTVAAGQLARGFEIAVREREDASLTLDRFEDEGCDRVIHRGFESLDRRVQELHTRNHRKERFLHGRLSREGEGAHRPPVEGIGEGEDPGPVSSAVQPGELERRFVGLRTRVREIHAAGITGSRESLELRGQAELRRGGEVVRHVREGRGLSRNRLDERGVCVPERVHRDTGKEVQVALTRVIPQVGALAAGEQSQAVSGVGKKVAAGIVLPGCRGRCLVVHCASFRLGEYCTHALTTSVPMPLLVKTSIRSECGTRPSMIAAVSTPPSTASRHACILGTIPDSSVGSIVRSSVELR